MVVFNELKKIKKLGGSMDLLIKFCKYAGLDYFISDSSSVVVQTTDVVTMCISLGSYIAENNSSDFESHALLSSLLHFHMVSFDKGIFYVKFYKLNN